MAQKTNRKKEYLTKELLIELAEKHAIEKDLQEIVDYAKTQGIVAKRDLAEELATLIGGTILFLLIISSPIFIISLYVYLFK